MVVEGRRVGRGRGNLIGGLLTVGAAVAAVAAAAAGIMGAVVAVVVRGMVLLFEVSVI